MDPPSPTTLLLFPCSLIVFAANGLAKWRMSVQDEGFVEWGAVAR
jgi:hypothetical protein